MKDLIRLRNTSIKDKLLLNGMLVTCFVLLFSSLIFLGSELYFLRNSLIDDLVSYAKTTSGSSVASLTFNDRKSAEETLQALSSLSTIVHAILYDTQGNVFAAYHRKGSMGHFEKHSLHESGYYFSFKQIDYYNPIFLNCEKI